ncbi:hypothetical protein A2U01_0116427, partial [Trifolium medium]|nr:hypothetical protein [Trifolium medium]
MSQISARPGKKIHQ